MAYVFLSDGAPDAEDYDSNYFYFDENNLQASNIAENLIANKDERDSEFRAHLRKICQSSFNNGKANTNNSNGTGWIKVLLKLFRLIPILK